MVLNDVPAPDAGKKPFIIDRAKKLLGAIEVATGRTISGKDSDEVQQAFGASLI